MKVCDTCELWCTRLDPGEEFGRCHRYPPPHDWDAKHSLAWGHRAALVWKISTGAATWGPRTRALDSCGEWRPLEGFDEDGECLALDEKDISHEQ